MTRDRVNIAKQYDSALPENLKQPTPSDPKPQEGLNLPEIISGSFLMSEMAAKGKPQLATGPQKLVPDAVEYGFAGTEVEGRIAGRAEHESQGRKETRWSALCEKYLHDAYSQGYQTRYCRWPAVKIGERAEQKLDPQIAQDFPFCFGCEILLLVSHRLKHRSLC